MAIADFYPQSSDRRVNLVDGRPERHLRVVPPLGGEAVNATAVVEYLDEPDTRTERLVAAPATAVEVLSSLGFDEYGNSLHGGQVMLNPVDARRYDEALHRLRLERFHL